MLIFKIFRPTEWHVLHAQGATDGAPIDVADGYIHFSTAAQIAETAAKHFADAGDLMVLALDSDKLGTDLKWEPSRGDQLFPHLYRQMRLADVLWARSFPQGEGGHILPEGIE